MMMFARSTFLIVLFGALLSNSVFAQDTSSEPETTEVPIVTTTTTTVATTPTRTTCNVPDEFPLFDDNTCISRTTYTAIFLTSIILAGLSFLMLIGIMLVYCCRHTELCGSYDESDIESSGSRRSVEKSSIGNTPSVSGGRGQYASPVQNMPGTIPIEVPKNQTPPPAPYSPISSVPKVVPRTKPTVQQGNGKTNVPESYEMAPRQANPLRTQPSTAPKTTDLDDRPVKTRPRKPTVNDETETSYF